VLRVDGRVGFNFEFNASTPIYCLELVFGRFLFVITCLTITRQQFGLTVAEVTVKFNDSRRILEAKDPTHGNGASIKFKGSGLELSTVLSKILSASRLAPATATLLDAGPNIHVVRSLDWRILVWQWK